MFRYSSRFWLYAPITLFLLLAVAVMVQWWMAADAFEKKLAALKGHRAIPGVTLDWATVQVGGFPFRLDADFTNFHITGAGAHGPFAWTTERFALHALTYNRAKIVYEAAGRQQVTWTDAQGGTHQASFLPGSLRASSVLVSMGLSRADLDIVDVAGQGFTIGRFQIHMRRGPAGLDLMLKADALQSSGAKAENLQAYAMLDQAGALASLLRGEMSWPQADANWRARDGQAKLSRVVARGISPDRLLSPLY